MTDETDPAPPASLLQRLLDAGIDPDRARARIADGGVRLEGDTVTDPDAPAPWPTPWVFGPT